mgnify:CR=1 FL=1
MEFEKTTQKLSCEKQHDKRRYVYPEEGKEKVIED